MFQNFLSIILTAAFLVAATQTSTTAAQSCPPAAELSPCTCDEATLNWDCSGRDVPDFNPKAIFDRVSPLVDQNIVFNRLEISYYMGRELPADTMTTLKFRIITLAVNSGLEFIHPEAFNETYGVTTELTIQFNRLTNSDNATDNYNFIGKFRKLESLTMGEFGMIYIPSDPFPEPLPYLHTWILLDMPRLELLGSRVLANLPALKTAQWKILDISINEFASDTFEGIGPLVELNLEHNPFSRLPEDVFKPVMEHASALRVGGTTCSEFVCGDIELDCDEVSAWLCDNEPLYRPKLTGFFCRRALGYNTIWDWCRAHGRSN